MVTPRAGLRLGATSQDDHLSTSHLCLELHWISLSQTSSLVSRSPGLLCLSLLITDDKVVDETRGLVTFIPGYMRCVQFLKMYLTFGDTVNFSSSSPCVGNGRQTFTKNLRLAGEPVFEVTEFLSAQPCLL